MADFSKLKIGSTSYNVKDAAAGRSLSFDNDTHMLSLQNAAGTGISTVNIPAGGGDPWVVIEGGSTTASENFTPGQDYTCTILDQFDANGQISDYQLEQYMTKFEFMGIPNPKFIIMIRGIDTYGYYTFYPHLGYENGTIGQVISEDVQTIGGTKYLRTIRLESSNGQISLIARIDALSSGGGASIDKYDVKRNGNLLFIASFVGSSDCELYEGANAVSYAQFANTDGPWILNLQDGQIMVNGKNDNNQELYCSVVRDSVPKFVTLVNQWSTTWNVMTANV